jgi:hypothetical protein
MNMFQILDRLNLEETPKAKAITIDREKLCNLLVEVELLLKLAIPWMDVEKKWAGFPAHFESQGSLTA